MALQQFARLAARHRRHDVVATRHLVTGQLLTGERGDRRLEFCRPLGALGQLQGGLHPFAELFVGHTEHRHIHNGRMAGEHPFDLGRVDVHAARDDHVDLAIRQIQVAVVVEVADVAEGEHAWFAVGLGGLRRVAEVLEVGAHGIAHMDDAFDEACCVGPGRCAGAIVFGHDLHDHVGHRLAHRTWLGEPFLGTDLRHHTAFGGAVVLGDLRAPPIDHVALHRGRAGCRTVQYELERRTAERVLGLLVGSQQTHELGGHEVHVRDGMAIDEVERLLGDELALHHDRRPTDEREERERPLRRVIVRAAEQGSAAGRETDVHHARGDERIHLGWHIGRERRVGNTFGATGGARGVEHHPTHHLTLGFGRVGAREQCLVLLAEAHHRHVHTRSGRGVLGVDDHHDRARVLHHVLHLVGGEVPVHRHHLEPGVRRGHEHLVHLASVARQQGQPLARHQPGNGAQHRDEAVHTIVELPPTGGTRVVDERRVVLGVGCCRDE